MVKILIHYRDLASRNCLVTDTLRVKISDFGMSRLEEQPSMPSSDGYPLLWTAPEVFKNGGNDVLIYTKKIPKVFFIENYPIRLQITH